MKPVTNPVLSFASGFLIKQRQMKIINIYNEGFRCNFSQLNIRLPFKECRILALQDNKHIFKGGFGRRIRSLLPFFPNSELPCRSPRALDVIIKFIS